MSRGILLVALPTPFTPEEDIDVGALQAHASTVCAAKVDLKLRVRQRLIDSAKQYSAVLRMPLGTSTR
jgi:hypothetical protein